MSINLKRELHDFADWLNEEKGYIFQVDTNIRLSWYDNQNLCIIKVVNNRIVVNSQALPFTEEFVEYMPTRKPGRQEDIEDYLIGNDDLNNIIQDSIVDFLEDKQYDIPAGYQFTHTISIDMSEIEGTFTTIKMELSNH